MRTKLYSNPLHASGIVSTNSLDYVAYMLRVLNSRETAIALKSRDDLARLQGLSVDRLETPSMRTGWFAERHIPAVDNSLALVTFTSGTTGVPKGILLTHAELADTVSRLIAVTRVDSSIREYVGVPVTGSFGLGRFRVCAAVGGQAYLPPRGFAPLEFADMLQTGQVNALSAVPTLLRVLLARPEIMSRAGPALRWLEIGSQHIGSSEKHQLKSIFPNARIVQHYGLTEASRTTFLDISGTDGARLDSVGQTVGATELAISADGRIRIRGPHVAQRWIGSEGIEPLVDKEGWLTTNDLGRIEDGYLYYNGRSDDQINCGGVKIDPEVLEDRLRTLVDVPDGIGVARTSDRMRGHGILVATDLPEMDLTTLRAAARSELEGLGVRADEALSVMRVNRLPITSTGKIQRHVLGKLLLSADAFHDPKSSFESSRHSALDEPSSRTSVETAVRVALEHALPGRAFTLDQTLDYVGADSMATLLFIMELERLLERKVSFDLIQPDVTLRDLSRALQGPTQAGSDRAPARIFLLPGLFGDEPILAKFRRAAADQVNLELVEIADLEESPAVLSDMNAMGEQAARDIATRQPDGPIVLAGYSFGGVVAWAAAASLSSAGRTVALVVILDSSSEKRLHVDFGSQKSSLMSPRIKQRIRRYKPRRGDSPKHYTMRLALNIAQEARAYDIARRLILRWRGMMPPRMLRDQRRQLLRYYRNKALSGWRRSPLEVQVLLVESEGSASRGLTGGWRRDNPRCETIRLPGGHRELFDTSQLTLLIPKLVQATSLSLAA